MFGREEVTNVEGPEAKKKKIEGEKRGDAKGFDGISTDKTDSAVEEQAYTPEQERQIAESDTVFADEKGVPTRKITDASVEAVKVGVDPEVRKRYELHQELTRRSIVGGFNEGISRRVFNSCFTLLQEAHRRNYIEVPVMRQDFIDMIDKLMKDGSVESVERHKKELLMFKELVGRDDLFEGLMLLRKMDESKSTKLEDRCSEYQAHLDKIIGKEDKEDSVVGLSSLRAFISPNLVCSLWDTAQRREEFMGVVELGEEVAKSETDQSFEVARREVALATFERIMSSEYPDLIIAYGSLETAHETQMPEFEEMKSKFLAHVTNELLRNNEGMTEVVQKRLHTIKQAVENFE
jgi:hypothetical protein